MTLLTHLSTLTPTQLRAQLIDPDPVQMHDWHVTADAYKAAVKVALIEKDKRYD
jgi:hypothetical protein